MLTQTSQQYLCVAAMVAAEHPGASDGLVAIQALARWRPDLARRLALARVRGLCVEREDGEVDLGKVFAWVARNTLELL